MWVYQNQLYGSKSSQGAARVFIIRNWDGKFIQVSAFNLGALSILIAETTAMRNGLQAAVQAGYANIQIEGDNRVLIQAIQGCIRPQWEIQILVQDILSYIQLCNKIFIHHIFREGNRELIRWSSLVILYIPRSSGM